jgi:tyrosyl-tRNA synthetase
MPILPGTDGKNKMSKSLGNYIGIDESPYTMFEKIMRMVDENIIPYFILLTDKPLSEISDIERKLKYKSEEVDVKEIKKELAFFIVESLHGSSNAIKAKESYGKEQKEGIREIMFPKTEISSDGLVSIIRLLQIAGRASSRSEARRLIEQGGVSIDNVKVTELDCKIKLMDGLILKVGKSFICKINV